MINDTFFQISILLGMTAAIAFVTRLLRQPLLISYIIAGIFAGPLLLNFVSGKENTYRVFSEFAIVLLLFIVGLSINVHYLKKIGRVAVATGVGQVVFTAIIGFSILRLLGLSAANALYLSVAITFSSTIIITKLLSDKKDLESVYGRYTIGLMLVQDIIAMSILILLNALKQEHGVALAESLTLFFLKGVALAAAMYFFANVFLPFLLERTAKSAEFLFLFTLAWCFGIASIVYALGFSLEIGAVMAGISLGSSHYQPEIVSRIRPLRDFFLIIFFIILGSGMDVSNLALALAPAIALSLFILIGNPLILYLIFRLMRFTRRNSFLAGLTAAQVSEFGFVLLFAGREQGYVSDVVLATFTLVALITIFISSYLITYNEQLYRLLYPVFALLGPDTRQQPEEDVPVYDAWVVGYHRMGWKICQALKKMDKSFAVIDFNPEVVKALKAKRIPVYFGDAADVEFLSELPIEKARLIISTIPEPDDQFTLISYIRSQNQRPYIIANLTRSQYLRDFYEAGANYVMMPHLLSGYWLAETLLLKKLSQSVFKKLRREQEKEMALRFSAQAYE